MALPLTPVANLRIILDSFLTSHPTSKPSVKPNGFISQNTFHIIFYHSHCYCPRPSHHLFSLELLQLSPSDTCFYPCFHRVSYDTEADSIALLLNTLQWLFTAIRFHNQTCKLIQDLTPQPTSPSLSHATFSAKVAFFVASNMPTFCQPQTLDLLHPLTLRGPS